MAQSRVQGERRYRSPPLALPDQLAVDATGGEPVLPENRISRQAGDEAQDDDISEDARQGIMVLDASDGTRPDGRVLFVVQPDLLRGGRGILGRHNDGAGGTVVDELMRDMCGAEDERTVGAAPPVGASYNFV